MQQWINLLCNPKTQCEIIFSGVVCLINYFGPKKGLFDVLFYISVPANIKNTPMTIADYIIRKTEQSFKNSAKVASNFPTL